MTQTKQEIRNKWIAENITKYNVYFNNKHDAELIDYVENEKAKGIKTVDVFRKAIKNLIK